MRKLTNVAVLAVVLSLGAAGTAGAQVIGTRGATMPGGGVPFQGYYSPYPGAVYSPFAPAPAVVGSRAFAGGTAFGGGPAYGGFGRPVYPSAVYGGVTTYPAYGYQTGVYYPRNYSGFGYRSGYRR